MNEIIPYVHYSWVVCIYIYAVYIMIQCTEPTIPADIACCELRVSLQEAVLGLKTTSPITVLSERGEGFFRQLWVSFPHFGKEQIKRIKTGTSNIQADADRCKQTQSALSTWPSLWTVIFPLPNWLVGSAKMLAMAYRLRCTPLSRPTHCNWHRTIETKQWLNQTITNRTQVLVLSVRHSRLWNWTGD